MGKGDDVTIEDWGYDLRAETKGRPLVAPMGGGGGGGGGGAEGAGDRQEEEGKGLVWSIEMGGRRKESL